MGIQGLLQFLKEASEPIHVRKYKGQTVAVDTYCWLHKGAFACAEKLAKGELTDQYVVYCMKFVHMLQSHGVRPILVFDGCTLPSKKDVERARREKRQVNLQKGKQLLREGKLSEARDCFSRSINITSDMAHEVIKAARAEGVDCIVAPYEADSQLAYLNKNGFAEAIITEDSDLLTFGCKKVILKMDKLGNGLEIDQARFGMCKHLGDVFTEEKFRYMCILSGCDYLPSIHGIGLAKASKLLKVANNPDIIQVIKKIGQYLKANITVPDGYIEGFIRADNTFLYQLVFDPVKRKLVPLNPYEDGIDPKELNYAGPNVGDSVAYQIALGNKDVNTMEQIDDYNPDVPQSSKQKSHSWNHKISESASIWQGKHTPCPNLKPEERPRTEEKANRRGLILPSNKHPVKRRQEDGASDSDLFSQYSFSQNKKPRREYVNNLTPLKASSPSVLHPLDERANNTDLQPKTRSTFFTFLQRKNKACDSISVTGTRSRFFCKPSESASSSSVDPTFPPANKETTNGCDAPCEVNQKTEESDDECKQEQTPSPVSEHCVVKASFASPLRNLRNCFSWSGSLTKGSPNPQNLSPSLLSLRRFQRNKPVLESNTENTKTELTNKYHANWDQTSLHSDLALIPSEKTSKLSVLEIEDSSSEDLDNSLESPCEFSLKTSPVHQVAFPERRLVPTAKVSGLLKPKSLDLRSGTKLKPMAASKASGLSIRARTTRNNENKLGLQSTINDLWKNFSFKKQ
ncbi:exonuclease 1 isoform X2 [Mixophyes fleayi]|uniref:exonuclease 1 isoform X2 n=2 Tax=Mixophyes fleayi TaxID=3061075 RepID=UPI003F4DE880